MDLMADAIVTNESVGFGIPKPTENRMSSQWWLESLMGVEHKLCLHRPHREINNYNFSNPDLFESQFSKKKKTCCFLFKGDQPIPSFHKKGSPKIQNHLIPQIDPKSPWRILNAQFLTPPWLSPSKNDWQSTIVVKKKHVHNKYTPRN